MGEMNGVMRTPGPPANLPEECEIAARDARQCYESAARVGDYVTLHESDRQIHRDVLAAIRRETQSCMEAANRVILYLNGDSARALMERRRALEDGRREVESFRAEAESEKGRILGGTIAEARKALDSARAEAARIVEEAAGAAREPIETARAEAARIVARARAAARRDRDEEEEARRLLGLAKDRMREQVAKADELGAMLDAHIARKQRVIERLKAECVRMEAVAQLTADRAAEAAEAAD